MAIKLNKPKHLEYKLRKTARTSLKHQYNYLKKHREELYDKPNSWIGVGLKTLYISHHGHKHAYGFDIDETKGLGGAELDVFRDTMGVYGMISMMYPDVERTVMNGYRARYLAIKKDMLNMGIDFNVKNPAVTKYLNEWRDLQLSDYKGSISRTTKAGVISIFQDAYANNLSVGEIQKNINALDENLFSEYRAKMIATNELCRAFETGNAIPMMEAQAQGAEVIKKWSAEGNCCDICAGNEDDGWIPFNDQHSSGDDMPPGHVNCRCDELYEVSNVPGDTGTDYEGE